MIKEFAAVIFYKNNSILMGLRHGTKSHNGLWGVPGGGVVEGETAFQAAIRESEEEVGLSPVEMSNPFVTREILSGLDLSFYLCTRWLGSPKNREPHACKEIQWFDINEIPKTTIETTFHALEYFRHNHGFRVLK
jgi:8-oxo-dGTP diphosphatase